MAKILIPPARISVIDQRTGAMSQPWYAFFAQFLQGASNEIDAAEVAAAALTVRVLTAENDVDALQSETANLFVDHAMNGAPLAAIDELRKRINDLETDYRPDPAAALDAMIKRIAELETELSVTKSPLAAIEELRKRVADIETDLEMGL
jgi:polyhydroxyalkanoate synthesis regulator phasin